MQAVPKIRAVFANEPELAALATAPLLDSAQELPAKIDQWFDSVMDRVSQRFALHTRLWTVIFSVLLAFALHLDALQLLRQLSTDGEMRARLIASADALARKADETVAPRSSETLHIMAMKELLRAHPAELGTLPEPTGFTDLVTARQWLTTQLPTAGVTNAEPWLKEYDAEIARVPLRTSVDDLRSILNEKLAFQLIPNPYPQPFWDYSKPSWRHLWGVIASAALLSLGAPFWFNVLKGMSNLRPILAQKEKQESAAPESR